MGRKFLKIIGELEPGKPTVLFIPGGMCSPAVYDGIEVLEGFQTARVDWSASEGPWSVDLIGKRIATGILVSQEVQWKLFLLVKLWKN